MERPLSFASRFFLSFSICCLAGATPVAAADHGDPILVVDETAAAVILIPVLATTQTLLWSGDPLVAPSDAIVAADGSVLVADPGAGMIFRFDWVAGVEPSPFAPLGVDLCWLEQGGGGAVILVSGPAGLVRIDPSSGSATPIPAALDTPFDLHLLPDGDVLVADPGLQALVRVDPGTGLSETFAPDSFNCWVDVGPQGGVVAVGPLGVFLVPPGGGDPQLLASGGFLSDPSAVVLGHHGDIYVADRGGAAGPAIVKVNPVSGAQTVVASGGLLVAPSAILVLDAEPAPVPALPPAALPVLVLLIVAFAISILLWGRRHGGATAPSQ